VGTLIISWSKGGFIMKTPNPWKGFDAFYRLTGGQIMEQCEKSNGQSSTACPNYTPMA
jgi:hypothetical protein